MKSKKYNLTKELAKPLGIVSNRCQLVDAENDECKHHGEGVVAHQPSVVV